MITKIKLTPNLGSVELFEDGEPESVEAFYAGDVYLDDHKIIDIALGIVLLKAVKHAQNVNEDTINVTLEVIE